MSAAHLLLKQDRPLGRRPPDALSPATPPSATSAAEFTGTAELAAALAHLAAFDGAGAEARCGAHVGTGGQHGVQGGDDLVLGDDDLPVARVFTT